VPATCQSNVPSGGSAVRFPEASTALEATVDLVARIRSGDEAAVEILVNRYLRPLRRISHNRLPRSARSMTDTDDVVQDALLSTVGHLSHFVCRQPGALLAYLRRVVLNRIIDERRKCARQGFGIVLPDDSAEQPPTPLQRVLGREEILRYRAALRRLKPRDRQLIMLRVEQRLTYAQIGTQLRLPSPDAARIASLRATRRFASALKHV
jgi:RNA polymerase sigma factor (sigma-70 family)